MGNRNPNHRLVKTHRSYDVAEIAVLLDVCSGTVRSWLRNGLTTIDERRPALIHGSVLVEFLKARRKSRKRPCGSGQLYCMRCREPRQPRGNQVICEQLTHTSGNLKGVCSHCDTRMFRRVNMAKLEQVAGDLHVELTEALEHIDESHKPSVNSDFNQEPANHE